MVLNIQENLSMERKVEKGKFNTLTILIMKDNLLIMCLMVKVHMLARIISTRVHGKKGKCMVQVKVNGLMIKEFLLQVMLVNTSME